MAIIKPFDWITIPDPAVNAEIALVFVKYKLPLSAILAVVNTTLPFAPFTEVTLLGEPPPTAMFA